jgi:hypothetical protein
MGLLLFLKVGLLFLLAQLYTHNFCVLGLNIVVGVNDWMSKCLNIDQSGGDLGKQ